MHLAAGLSTANNCRGTAITGLISRLVSNQLPNRAPRETRFANENAYFPRSFTWSFSGLSNAGDHRTGNRANLSVVVAERIAATRYRCSHAVTKLCPFRNRRGFRLRLQHPDSRLRGNPTRAWSIRRRLFDPTIAVAARSTYRSLSSFSARRGGE